ncbi:periplasmic binding protein [Ketogulonicigenium robustum]|uniref:Periplasmic binding protein n=1 Tax=Ketogulonicigenium robustum TaxID=92947 RepID=A0A1W6NXF4_9RHOB|nr:periplasmic binding protein [Ketogulonicigenium robustum]
MLGALLVCASTAQAGDPPPPARVVSINLCTDQLALQLAAPGQIVSLSAVARDAQVSPLAEAAMAYPVNHGSAEEVFRLQPDLVLASAYTSPVTVGLLRRLGLRVEQFPPEDSFDDIRANTRRMGELLGQPDVAERLIAGFGASLAEIPPAHRKVTAVIYGPNGFASAGTGLPDALLRAAGLTNAANDVLAFSGTLALEKLVMLAPEMIITPTPYPGASRAEELLRHPALAGRAGAGLAGNEWACGTVMVARAVARLAAAREALE